MVRESLYLPPVQKMQVVEYEGRIELIPERDIAELQGILREIGSSPDIGQNEVWLNPNLKSCT